MILLDDPRYLGPGFGKREDRAPGGETCYWERLSGLSGTIDDVIANDLPSGQAVVEIAGDDVAFNSTDCGEWSPGS